MLIFEMLIISGKGLYNLIYFLDNKQLEYRLTV